MGGTTGSTTGSTKGPDRFSQMDDTMQTKLSILSNSNSNSTRVPNSNIGTEK